MYEKYYKNNWSQYFANNFYSDVFLKYNQQSITSYDFEFLKIEILKNVKDEDKFKQKFQIISNLEFNPKGTICHKICKTYPC